MAVVNIRLTWPIQDLSAVCAIQDAAGGAALVLNGTLSKPSSSVIKFPGFIRNLSITAGATDLDGVVFTINGIQNGVSFSDSVNGPTAHQTVYNTFSFDTITSITVDSPVTDVIVGTGLRGYLPPIQVNIYGDQYISWGLSTVHGELFGESEGCTYQAYITLDDVVNNGRQFDYMVDPDYSPDDVGDNTLFKRIFVDGSSNPLVGENAFFKGDGMEAKYIIFQIVTCNTQDSMAATYLQVNS